MLVQGAWECYGPGTDNTPKTVKSVMYSHWKEDPDVGEFSQVRRSGFRDYWDADNRSYIPKPKPCAFKVATLFRELREDADNDLFYQRLSRPDSHRLGRRFLPPGSKPRPSHVTAQAFEDSSLDASFVSDESDDPSEQDHRLHSASRSSSRVSKLD